MTRSPFLGLSLKYFQRQRTATSVYRRLHLEVLEPLNLLAPFFDDGTLALEATNRGLVEPPVPIFHNGVLINGTNHQIVEASDQVPSTSSFPLTLADIHANTYVRVTYQKADGTTGQLGTSIVGSASFRTADDVFHFVPTVNRGDVFTGGAVRYQSTIAGQFGSLATTTTSRTFPDPIIGRTTVGLTVGIEATENLNLKTGAPFVGNDRFRVVTASSMFADSTQFDANIIRYEDSSGNIQVIALGNATPRDQHLLPAPDEIGDWFELVKTPGSTWFPDSPTIRVDITDKDGLQLGLQGFLAASTDPTDDSLNVWLEWMDAPNVISDGISINVGFQIVSVPPSTADPVIGNFGGPITYVENAIPRPISTTATVIDHDSANFAGGQLTVQLTAGGRPEDRLAIRTAGNISTTDGQVRFTGIVIGTFTGGIGTTPLVVTLNSQATPGRVQGLLRNIVYSNISEDPFTNPRTVSAHVTDGDGGTSIAVTKLINVTAVNDRPVIGGVSGSVGYTLNGPPVILASSAVVNDVDTTNFATGKLTVRITAGQDTENRIEIGGTLFSLNGNTVRRNGVAIGTLNDNGGRGFTKFEVTFNANANAGVAQELIRALRFRTVNGTNMTQRTVSFSVSDGEGRTSIAANKTVVVSA